MKLLRAPETIPEYKDDEEGRAASRKQISDALAARMAALKRGEFVYGRTFHLPKYHPANPVLKPDKPWEMKNPDHAAAMVFSDGVWYDPKDQLFKMWYLVGESAATGYATSRDGIHWEKPLLDVRPPTIVQPGGRDSSTVWLDRRKKRERVMATWRRAGLDFPAIVIWAVRPGGSNKRYSP